MIISTESMVYTNWQLGYPRDEVSARCVVLDGRTGLWRNSECNDIARAVCAGTLRQDATDRCKYMGKMRRAI